MWIIKEKLVDIIVFLSTMRILNSGQLICTHIHIANGYNNVYLKRIFIKC